MDYEYLINQCKKAISSLQEGKIFKVKDLFTGVYWNSLEKGVRLELGRRFKLCVNRNEIINAQYFGKAANNSALYIKQAKKKV